LIHLEIISHALVNLGIFILPEFLMINGIAMTSANIEARLLHVNRHTFISHSVSSV